MIKIIKRNSTPELPITATIERPKAHLITGTVRNWIAESRKNRLDEASYSRKTIADWATESNI